MCAVQKSSSLDLSRISPTSGHHTRYLSRYYSSTSATSRSAPPASPNSREVEVRITHQDVGRLHWSPVWNTADTGSISLAGGRPPRRVDPSLRDRGVVAVIAGGGRPGALLNVFVRARGFKMRRRITAIDLKVVIRMPTCH